MSLNPTTSAEPDCIGRSETVDDVMVEAETVVFDTNSDPAVSSGPHVSGHDDDMELEDETVSDLSMLTPSSQVDNVTNNNNEAVDSNLSSSSIPPPVTDKRLNSPAGIKYPVMSYRSPDNLNVLPMVEIRLGSLSFNALVDTGAEYSSISSLTFEKMIQNRIGFKRSSNLKLMGVGQKLVRVNWELSIHKLVVIFDNEWLFEDERVPQTSTHESRRKYEHHNFAVVDSGYDIILGIPEIRALRINNRLSRALRNLGSGDPRGKNGKARTMMSVTSLGRAWRFAQSLDHSEEQHVSLSAAALKPLDGNLDVGEEEFSDEPEDPDQEDYVPLSIANWGLEPSDIPVRLHWTHTDDCRDAWGIAGNYTYLARKRGFATKGGRASSVCTRERSFSPSRSGSSRKRKWINEDASNHVYPYHPVELVEDEYVCVNTARSIVEGHTSSSTELLGSLPDEDDEFEDISPFLDVDYSKNVYPTSKGEFSDTATDGFKNIWKRRQKVFGTSLARNGANVTPLEIQVYPGSKPVSMPPRRFSKPIQELIDAEVKKLFDDGLISESTSDYSAEIVMVKQKEKFRMCIDYSAVNKTLVGMKHPIPNIRELLDSLAGKKFLGKLDLRSGYHQFPVDKDSRKFTAFRVGCKLYEFNRIPFGLKMAPAYFQMIMQQMLGSTLGRCCYVYLDDIIIFGDTEEQFQVNLDEVLRCLEASDMVLRGDKCLMATADSSLEILGYEINDQGITLSMSKKQGLLDMQRPTSQQTLRSFNGLANYFRPFIDNFANIIKPLTAASGKALKEWTREMDGAFAAVKLAVEDLDMLYYLDDEQPLFLRTDASNTGVGGVLFQRFTEGKVVEERPIAFVSKAFNETEQNWSTIEQEGFAIFHCVMKLDHYLKGREFTIETDHRNLVYMANSLTPKVIRWRLRLLEFDFVVKHIAGEANVVADALSRCLITRTLVNSRCGSVAVNLGTVAPVYQMSDEHRQEIASVHNPIIGHFSSDRTIKLLEAQGKDWNTREADVKAFISSCGKCQKTAKGRGTIEEAYRSTMTDLPFAKTAVDTVGPFPKDADGNMYIIVAIDCFTRVVELKATKTAEAVEAARFLLEIFGRYGPPRMIHSDNGPQFAAKVVVEFVKLFKTEKSVTLPYRPQANGINERVNGEVLRHLTALTMDSSEVKSNWSVSLPIVARIINYSYHSAIGTYPAQLLYGRNTNGTGILLDGVTLPKPKTLNQKDSFAYLGKLVKIQRDVLKAAQEFQSKVIKSRVEKIPSAHKDMCTTFRAGDFVLASYPSRKPTKLAPPWRGPFMVVDKVKANTYRIQHLNEKGRVEVLHVSRLRIYDATFSDPDLAAAMDDSSNTIDFIVEHHPRGPFGRKKRDLEFRVRWAGYSEEEDLWIPYTEMADTEALELYMADNGLFFK